jgi:predicted O-methyltransferase YrrM
MKLLEENNNPIFDFCYLDGAHDWATDGFAFLLVDKLLKPGGWIIFDDIDWSYAKSPALKEKDFVKRMSEEERTTHQVRKVYELLVKTHPNYDSFKVESAWAYARKSDKISKSDKIEIKKEIVYKEKHVGLGAAILKIGKKITGK